MKVHLNPVLSFRGVRDDTWRVSCLIVTQKEPGQLEYGDGQEASPSQIYEYKNKQVWRYDLAIELTENQQNIDYRIPNAQDTGWSFSVPSKDAIPQIAYASCNGFGHLKEAKKVDSIHALWEDLGKRHDQSNYHLFLMGGDQVYGDPLWEQVPEIKKWSEKNVKSRRLAKFSQKMEKQLEDFYMSLYLQRWSQPKVNDVFSRVPTVMMWDDHDIFDGWGSHPKEDQECPVFKGIYSIASKYFRVFQQQLAQGEPHPASCDSNGYSMGFDLGDLAIMVLDMRSERTNTQVLSPDTWRNIYGWLDNLTGAHKHLYVMSSIPVVHPDFSMIEGILGIFPGQQSLEDDLRDHWHSRPHRGERLRLIHRLLSLSSQKNFRTTILSGDVHVAALGAINSLRNTEADGRSHIINQLTSSGIVHPAPPAVVLLALKILGADTEEVDQGITAELINFPGTKHSFIGARNYLSLEPDDRGRIWANWIVEGEEDGEPYTKVIHPVNFSQ